MPPAPGRISPVTAFIRRIEPGMHYTTAEAARLIGTTEGSLRRWMIKDRETYGPSFDTHMGKLKLFVWDEGDILRVRAAYTKARKAQTGRFTGRRGQVALFTDAERIDRRRRSNAATYARRASARLAGQGHTEQAIDMMAKASAITRRLRAEHSKREREIRAAMK
jgi:hypothetical protein